MTASPPPRGSPGDPGSVSTALPGSLPSTREAGSGAPVGQALVLGLSVRDFRNLEAVSFSAAPRLNIVWGDNGQGKTSLIEALYVLCTTRSFRSSRLGETVRDGQAQARILGKMSSLGLAREQRASLSLRGRSFLLDGKRPKRHIEYALKTPVIAFHPGDLALVSGAASLRRTLLDRIVLHIDPPGADARLRYQTALRERQALLDRRGPHAGELGVFEQVVAETGARLQLARRRAATRLVEALLPAFSRMATADHEVGCHYQPGGSEDVEVFAKSLADRRTRDVQRGAATFGPHKDELQLSVGGRPARSHASQGQQRLLTLSLKLAELACVREAAGIEPILLLDDVSSELDPHRTEAVFRFLRESRSQIFVTTTRPELFSEVDMGADQRRNFRMDEGALTELGAGFVPGAGGSQK